MISLVSFVAASRNAPAAFFVIGILAIVIMTIAGIWATFVKAGQPGWAAIVPIYNVYVMCKVAEKPAWWMVLFLLPFVSVIASLVISIEIARRFEKGAAFGLGLWLMPPAFFPILGFGRARYLEA